MLLARRMFNRDSAHAYLLLTPLFVLLSLFAFIPTVQTVWSSLFSKGTVRRPSQFVGLDNYSAVMADPTFWLILKNNLWYAVITIPASILLALLMALWANQAMSMRAWVRCAYFTPTMLPMIAAANLWLFFYTPELGLLDQIFGLFGAASTNWLGQPQTALAAVVVVTIWKEAGFFMIFYLAALQTVSPELRDAARLEGASRWQYGKRVLLPLLAPTTLFILINALINSVKLIDHLFILTKGGPNNSSKLLLYWIWENAFAYMDTPSAAVLTVMLLFALGAVAVFKFSYAEKRVHYQ
ncbi:sugar ABC transporter permease [Paenalcaligenes niemegkensis]|uniref:carbohydrate ABC transporter permease n=1 Tax=Paenalcaligenes niemegkensis TaxID=2895469 RepID=UPI001EE92453|nr:sugar ABC transporter permease [Paenalcaligenes niemegkensis]MCQ9616704.1 sugar ABC transporter permease [Paenalcaligenes niemegkensis]